MNEVFNIYPKRDIEQEIKNMYGEPYTKEQMAKYGREIHYDNVRLNNPEPSGIFRLDNNTILDIQ